MNQGQAHDHPSYPTYPMGPAPMGHAGMAQSRSGQPPMNLPVFTFLGLLWRVMVFGLVYVIGSFGIPGTIVLLIAIIALSFMRNWIFPMLAFVIAMMLLTANDYIVFRNFIVGGMRMVVVGILLLRILITGLGSLDPESRREIMGYLKPIWIFSCVAALTSVLSGWYVHVSLLKIAQFAAVLTAMFFCMFASRIQVFQLLNWIIALCFFYIVGSLSLYKLLPQYGFIYDEISGMRLFQGLTYQPQALAIILAMSGCFLFQLIASPNWKMRLSVALLIVLTLGLMFLTRSRSGMLGLIGLFGTFYVFSILHQMTSNQAKQPGAKKSYSMLYALALCFIIGAIYLIFVSPDSVRTSLVDFVLKWSSKDISLSSILESRMSVVENSWAAFMERPIFGEGFGVERSYGFVANASLLTAPTEKSFWPTGVLHELGIVGGIAFLYFIWALFRNAYRYRRYSFMAMLFAYMVFNLGEFSIFSFGGMGAFSWLMIIIFSRVDIAMIPSTSRSSVW